MNFRTTYILFGVLLVVVVLFVVALYWGGTPEDTSAFVLPAMHDEANPMKPEDVERVRIERARPKEETLVFERGTGDGEWAITEPTKLRADAFAVNELVRDVYNARPMEKFDKPESLESWGLEPPAAVITLVKGDREVKLEVGDATGKGDNDLLYVRDPARGEAVPVRRLDLDSVMKGLAAFRSRDLIGGSFADIRSVSLSETKDHPEGVALEEAGTGEWKFVKPDYGAADYEGGPATGTGIGGVRSLLQDVSNLRVKDPEAGGFVAEGPQDLAKYHLDPAKANVLRIEVERKGKDKPVRRTLLVGVQEKAGEGKDAYYARVEGEKPVVLVDAAAVENLRALLDEPGAIRDRDLVRLPAVGELDAIDVKNSYGTLEFRKVGGEWKLYRDGKAAEVERLPVEDLRTALTAKGLVKDFRDAQDKAKLGLDKPQAEVALWVDGVEKQGADDKDGKDEKKDEKPKLKEPNKPRVRLRFGNRVEDKVAVERVREGQSEGSVVLVPGTLLDRVQKGPLAYLDKTLPTFTTTLDVAEPVTKLTITRDGTTYELTPAKEGGGWTIAKPEALAGRKADAEAVESILQGLNFLQAEELVAEKPAEERLERDYGLKTPRVKAVVTVKKDDKEKSYEYSFGKPAGEGVFALQSERPVVFKAGKTILDTLNKDLRDPTVFSFGISEVKTVKLTGWYSVLGAPFTLEVEHKGGSDWAVKSSTAPLTLDPAKMQRFVDELSRLRAERFLDGQKPGQGHGLEAKDNALTVEVTLEGEDKPRTLTVGKPVGDKGGYYATSNQLPDTLIEVRRDLFEGPKERPAYFGK